MVCRAGETRRLTPSIDNQPDGTSGHEASGWCATLWHAIGVTRGLDVPLVNLLPWCRGWDRRKTASQADWGVTLVQGLVPLESGNEV